MCSHGLVEVAAGAEVGDQKTIKDLMAVSKSLPITAREDEGLAHGQPDRSALNSAVVFEQGQ